MKSLNILVRTICINLEDKWMPNQGLLETISRMFNQGSTKIFSYQTCAVSRPVIRSLLKSMGACWFYEWNSWINLYLWSISLKRPKVRWVKWNRVHRFQFLCYEIFVTEANMKISNELQMNYKAVWFLQLEFLQEFW